MFRQLFRIPKCAIQLSAAAVAVSTAISDKDLAKKPQWYQETVHALESSIKKLSQYTSIEDKEFLDNAQDILQRVVDTNHSEISWRLGRTLLEKAELSKDAHEQEHLLHEAFEHFHKALALESATGSAGAHKWYAIALHKIVKVNKKDPHAAHAQTDAIKHLEKAVLLDPKDPVSWHFLGLYHYENKDYSEASNAFKKAEELKPEFSSANLYYLGEVCLSDGKKDEAKKLLTRVLQLDPLTTHDSNAKVRAKQTLITKLKVPAEELYFSRAF